MIKKKIYIAWYYHYLFFFQKGGHGREGEKRNADEANFFLSDENKLILAEGSKEKHGAKTMVLILDGILEHGTDLVWSEHCNLNYFQSFDYIDMKRKLLKCFL